MARARKTRWAWPPVSAEATTVELVAARATMEGIGARASRARRSRGGATDQGGDWGVSEEGIATIAAVS